MICSILVCEGDPRVPMFYVERRAFALETNKLKATNSAKLGLPHKIVTQIHKKIPKRPSPSEEDSLAIEDCLGPTIPPRKKIRRSADRDLANMVPFPETSGRPIRSGWKVSTSPSFPFHLPLYTMPPLSSSPASLPCDIKCEVEVPSTLVEI